MNKNTEELISGLYKTIWAVSDSIGLSLEAANNNIPQRHINPQALSKRLLSDGMIQVARSLELLESLEENLNSDT